jgi:hypothetical protein
MNWIYQDGGGKVKPLIGYSPISESKSLSENDEKLKDSFNKQNYQIKEEEKQGRIYNQSPKKTLLQQTHDVLLNPNTALKYTLHNQPLPNHFEQGDRNPLDYAVDVVNPLNIIDAISNLPKHIKNNEWLNGLQDVTMIIPALSEIAPHISPLKAGIKDAGEILLPNAYKLNPFAEKLNNPNSFYRIADEASYNDFINSGVVRSKSAAGLNETNISNRILDRSTSFPSFDKGKINTNYFPENGNAYIYKSDIPMFARGEINPVTNTRITGRHFAYRPIDMNTGNVIKEIPKEQIQVFKGNPHWLKGYEEIKIPTNNVRLSEHIAPEFYTPSLQEKDEIIRRRLKTEEHPPNDIFNTEDDQNHSWNLDNYQNYLSHFYEDVHNHPNVINQYDPNIRYDQHNQHIHGDKYNSYLINQGHSLDNIRDIERELEEENQRRLYEEHHNTLLQEEFHRQNNPQYENNNGEWDDLNAEVRDRNQLPAPPDQIIIPTSNNRTHSINLQKNLSDEEKYIIERNNSGFTRKKLIDRNIIKDPKYFDQFDFKNTLLTPNGRLINYDPSVKELPYEKIPLDDYVNHFNKNIDELNHIISKKNTTGVEYVAKDLDKYGILTFDNPSLNDKSAFNLKINNGRLGNIEIPEVGNSNFYKDLPGLNATGTSGSVFGDYVPREGSRAYESLNEYLKSQSLGRLKTGFNTQSTSALGSWENHINKNRAVGFYNNPFAIHGSFKKEGGIIKDDMGQWKYPGKITRINSNDITMKNVQYPMIGVSNMGERKFMLPEKDYNFNGNNVTEYPIMENGGQNLSVVDYLSEHNLPFDKKYRASLAKKYNIENYNYSADKNIELLNKLKQNLTPENNKQYPISINDRKNITSSDVNDKKINNENQIDFSLLKPDSSYLRDSGDNTIVNKNIDYKKQFINKEKTNNDITDWINIGINGIKRQYDKIFGDDSTTQSKIPQQTIQLPQPPPIITGDTLWDDKEKGIYHIPEIIDLKRTKFGYRNRNDLTPVKSDGYIFGSIDSEDNPNKNPLLNSNDKSIKNNNIYVGIDNDGNIAADYGVNLKNTEKKLLDFNSYENITGFAKDKDGKFILKKSDAAKGYSIPLFQTEYNTINGTSGTFLKNNSDANKYGNITGGHLIIATPDLKKQILISGSLNDIDNQLQKFKKENNVNKVTVVQTDNGTYSRNFRTQNGMINSEQWKILKDRNTGGSSGFYLKGKGYKNGGTINWLNNYK